MKRLHDIVLALCLVAAFFLLRDFWSHPRSLWTSMIHDRNGHYAYGQDMAQALERFDIPQFFAQLEKGKVWPPLHGLLVMVTQVLSGNDWRMAVLPSLSGWILMLWCVYYTAQRVTYFTGLPWVAGLVGLLFAVISPGAQIYATDIMLESLGAGFTMLALACYACAVEERDSEARWRALAVALTFSFFEKYNYWMIVAVSLALAEAGTIRTMAVDWLKKNDLRILVGRQLREPLNWVVVIMAGVVLWLFARGPTALHIGGRQVSLFPPNNLVTITYAVFFVRVLLGIRRTHWKPSTAQERMLFYWHVVPIAVSFLLPQRLSVFVGFLSPTNHDAVPRNIPNAAIYYWQSFLQDYNASTALACIALVLAFIALLHFRKLGPAGRAVLICMLLGAALNLLHPNQKSRFLHSWMPAVWTSAGIGAALALQRVPRRREMVAGIGVAVLAIVAGSAASQSIAAREKTRSSASLLDMSDRWLADIAGSRRTAFGATQPGRPFIEWSFMNRVKQRDRFEWPAWQNAKTTEEMDAQFNRWIAETKADALVFVQVEPGSPEFTQLYDTPALRGEYARLMQGQSKFKEVKRYDFLTLGCAVTIWRADAGEPAK